MPSDPHVATTSHDARRVRRRLPRRHVLMLALAVEILAFGFAHADRNRGTAAIAVEPPSVPGHVIT